MVNFGEHLRKEQTDDWSGEYLDYDMLKRKLSEVVEQQEQEHAAVAAALRVILQGLFDSQIEKVRRLHAHRVPSNSLPGPQASAVQVLAFYARKAAEVETAVAQASEEVQRILQEVTPDGQGTPERKVSLTYSLTTLTGTWVR